MNNKGVATIDKSLQKNPGIINCKSMDDKFIKFIPFYRLDYGLKSLNTASYIEATNQYAIKTIQKF